MKPSREWKECLECNKMMQRCVPVFINEKGQVYWVCRKCFDVEGYNDYVYEHRQKRGKEETIQ